MSGDTARGVSELHAPRRLASTRSVRVAIGRSDACPHVVVEAGERRPVVRNFRQGECVTQVGERDGLRLYGRGRRRAVTARVGSQVQGDSVDRRELNVAAIIVGVRRMVSGESRRPAVEHRMNTRRPRPAYYKRWNTVGTAPNYPRARCYRTVYRLASCRVPARCYR